MLVANIILSNFPALTPNDKVAAALQIMSDYDVQHLPVVNEEKFVGIIVKDDLLDVDEESVLAILESGFLNFAVNEQEHIFTAIKVTANHQLTVLPIINDQKELTGVVLNIDLIGAVCNFLSVEEPGAVIVLELEKRNYAFGEISRLVETNDAYITQLNTYTEKETGLLLVTIKINKFEVSDIVATFQRYDYTVKYYFGEEQYGNELKDNYDLLMTYLKM